MGDTIIPITGNVTDLQKIENGQKKQSYQLRALVYSIKT
jgi:hypothetical protein